MSLRRSCFAAAGSFCEKSAARRRVSMWTSTVEPALRMESVSTARFLVSEEESEGEMFQPWPVEGRDLASPMSKLWQRRGGAAGVVVAKNRGGKRGGGEGRGLCFMVAPSKGSDCREERRRGGSSVNRGERVEMEWWKEMRYAERMFRYSNKL